MMIPGATYIKITHNFFVPRDKYKHADYDADMFCLPLNAVGVIESGDEVVFFNNLSNKNKSICLYGDCLSGCVDCGEASVGVDLSSVPDENKTLLVLSHLYQAQEREISFCNGVSEVVITRLNQPMECHGETIITQPLASCLHISDTIELCRLIRMGHEWKAIFPDSIRVEVSFKEYLKSFGVTF